MYQFFILLAISETNMRYPKFSFTITHQHHGARTGLLNTPHGVVETPNFIFCGTKAAIKGLGPDDMRAEGTQIILSNTYHLMLQPGAETVAALGGLHKMMNWHGPMFTDSGGYQIFSLGHGSVAEEIKGKRNSASSLVKISEEGAVFRSYIDGTKQVLTPERSIDIQHKLGADLIVVLDECTPFNVDKNYTKRSMEMSHRWAMRSLQAFDDLAINNQALYGIIQGGVYDDLRQQSTTFVNEQDFFAHAIGGSLGASKQQMHDIVSYTASLLRKDRPVHLLGIGGVKDIFHGVTCGIDTFDCVHPTRLARHGGALMRLPDLAAEGLSTTHEHLNLRNSRFKEDPRPIDSNCTCKTCRSFSRGYLHHLLKAKEVLAISAITIHNVHFMNVLMQRVREAIKHNNLTKERSLWLCY